MLRPFPAATPTPAVGTTPCQRRLRFVLPPPTLGRCARRLGRHVETTTSRPCRLPPLPPPLSVPPPWSLPDHSVLLQAHKWPCSAISCAFGLMGSPPAYGATFVMGGGMPSAGLASVS